MKNTKILIVIIAVLVVLFFVLEPFYILDEGELAVVTRFGKIVDAETEAGLKFKWPVPIEHMRKYSKKIQSWDGEAQRFPTKENQLIWVDITARWKITDPQLFYESLGSINQAHSRLDDVVNSSARDIIAQNLLREAVRNSDNINSIKRVDVYKSSVKEGEESEAVSNISTFTNVKYEHIEKGRSELSQEMLDVASETTKSYGIELIDVIVRQIKYSDDITQNVYKQMIKERNQIARAFRSDGEGERAKWLGKTEKELRTIRSDAERQAKEIKSKADALALEIRNKAYGKDPNFADFWMALVQYQKILPKMNKTMTTDFEFFKHLYKKDAK